MKEKTNIHLFYIAYFLFLIHSMCSKVVFLGTANKYIVYIVPCLLGFNILVQSQKYKLGSIIRIYALVVITALIYYLTGDEALFCAMLFIVSKKDIDFDKFLKKDILFKIIIMIFVVLCYKMNLTRDTLFTRSDGTIRYTLGFDHPNHLGLYLFSICCGLCYLHYGKYKFVDYLALLCSFLVCYFVCDSRSPQIGLAVLVIMMIITTKAKITIKNNKLIGLLPVILCIFSFVFTVLYIKNNPFAVKLDRTLNNRLYFSANFMEHYGINLFGHKFTYYGIKWHPLSILDNSYMHLLIHFGISGLILFMTCSILLIKYAIKEKKYEIIVYLIPFLIYGIVERHIYEVQYNCILLLISDFIYIKNIKEEREAIINTYVDTE